MILLHGSGLQCPSGSARIVEMSGGLLLDGDAVERRRSTGVSGFRETGYSTPGILMVNLQRSSPFSSDSSTVTTAGDPKMPS